MQLTQQERETLIRWLNEDIDSNRSLIDQLRKTGLGRVADRMENEMKAEIIVLSKLVNTEPFHIG